LEEAHAGYQSALELLEPKAAEEALPAQYRYELARTYYNLAMNRGPRPDGTPDAEREPPPDGDPHSPPDRPGSPPPGPRPGGARLPDVGPMPPHHGQHHPQRLGDPLGHPRGGRRGHGHVGYQAQRDAYLARAVALLEELRREDPSAPAYRHLLALCYRDSLPWRPFDREAVTRLDKATEILAALVADFPGVPDYRYDLIEAYAAVDARGASLTPELAPIVQERLETALRLSEQLVAEHPNVPAYAAAQVHVLHKLAGARQQTSRGETAEETLRKAVELQASLVDRYPQADSYRVWLATVQRSLARRLVQQNEAAEAWLLLEESIAVLRPLCQRDDASPHVRRLLAGGYHSLADVLHRLNRPKEAAKAHQQARQYRPGSHGTQP
jgi:tetratricopeptide (TPR) repeat protein